MVVGHVEVPFTMQRSGTPNVPLEARDPAKLKVLAEAGIDVASLSANHLYDEGEAGSARHHRRLVRGRHRAVRRGAGPAAGAQAGRYWTGRLSIRVSQLQPGRAQAVVGGRAQSGRRVRLHLEQLRAGPRDAGRDAERVYRGRGRDTAPDGRRHSSVAGALRGAERVDAQGHRAHTGPGECVRETGCARRRGRGCGCRDRASCARAARYRDVQRQTDLSRTGQLRHGDARALATGSDRSV